MVDNIDNVIKNNEMFEFIECFDDIESALYCAKSFFENCVCEELKNKDYVLYSASEKIYSMWISHEMSEMNEEYFAVIKCYN